MLLICSYVTVPVSEANGRATLVSSQEKGPFNIDLSIIPGRAVVPSTHVSVLIRSTEDDGIVTDAEVLLWATGPAGSTKLGPIPAENSFAPQFYETDLKFDLIGTWDVKLSVSSPLGMESVSLDLEVEEGGNNINWIMISAIVIGIFAIGLFIWDKVTGRNSHKNVS